MALPRVAFADPAPPPAASTQRPTSCLARLEQARAELLRLDFAPTTDKDTARWLTVRKQEEGVLALSLQMRTSADGAQTGFHLAIYKPSARKVAGWRFKKHRLCCDDHSAWEDHILELEWERQAPGRAATITVRQFGGLSAQEAAVARGQRALFVRVARQAANDCLASKTPLE